jgi:serine/threonine protein kinase
MMSQKSGSSGESFSFEGCCNSESPDDEQVTAALEEYARLRKAGEAPTREDFLALHHSIADVLGECLDGLEFVEDAACDFSLSKNRLGSAADLGPPAQLGEFRLVREIGHGGMGVVYEAEQVTLGRRVALKVLPCGASLDSRHRRRFQVEAQAAGLLHHEHIVPVFGTGFDAGVHYYVMQFIDGRPLTDLLRELKMARPPLGGDAAGIEIPQLALAAVGSAWMRPRGARSTIETRRYCQKAVRWTVQAADALDHAHQIGVIHRDVKPSNLLIDRRGRLWVTDFGLARLPQENHELTHTGDEVGTLRYMSPEQLSGDNGPADARADIYALGATLYELLTLQPAFGGRDRQELRTQILRHEPALPRRLNPSIPRDLETVVLKAIEKEPSARYGSAREFAADLRRFLADQPVRARRPNLVHRVIKWSSRHRVAVVTAALALFLTLSASTLALWEVKRRNDASMTALRRVQVDERVALELALSTIDETTRPVMEERERAADGKVSDEAARVLPHAIVCADQIRRVFSENESMAEVVAKASRQCGRARLLMNNPRGRDDYRRAIGVYEQIAARFPERIWLRTGLIDTLNEQARMLEGPADKAEVQVSISRAAAVAGTLIGDRAAAQPCFCKGLIGPFNALARKIVSETRLEPASAEQAVLIARQAVDWDTARPDSWRSLAIACSRAGDWKSASDALRHAMELDDGGTAADWFRMAAIEHYLGNLPDARSWFHRAVSWLERAQVSESSSGLELYRARQEAIEALGPEAPDTQPAPSFSRTVSWSVSPGTSDQDAALWRSL